MIIKPVISNSNSINRYGWRLHVEALVNGLIQNGNFGFPLTVAHDFSRIWGWAFPYEVHLQPNIAFSSMLQYYPENNEDKEYIQRVYENFIVEIAKAKHNEIEQLKSKLSSYMNDNAKITLYPAIAVVDENIAVRVFPEIFEKQDKDGLIPLSELNPIGAGAYKKGDFILFAHSYFRRSLFTTNSLNQSFLLNFQNSANKDFNPRIALDKNMIGHISGLGEAIELAYWWGPQFNEDLSNIPTGITEHRMSDNDRIYYGLTKTEFWWQSRKGEHILEIEEVSDKKIPNLVDEKYSCRYVHSMVEEETNRIHHLDGAIRVYSDLKMLDRVDKKLSESERNTDYTKLWRIDGNIGISNWKSLISDYFRDNYLIGEYFGLERPSFSSQQSNSTITQTLVDEYMPYLLNSEDGVLVSMRFLQDELENSDVTYTHKLFSRLTLNAPNGITYSVMENFGVELYKVIKLNGGKVNFISPDKYVKFKDKYLNLPTIFHSPNFLAQNIEISIGAIGIIAKHLDETKKITFSFGIPFENGTLLISFMACSSEITKFFKHKDLALLPKNWNDILVWSSKFQDYLDTTYPNQHKIHEPLRLLNNDILAFSRVFIDPDLFTYRPEGIVFPLEVNGLRETLFEEGIIPSVALEIISSTCERCNKSFRDCSCSKVLDGTRERIDDYGFLLAFWTNII